MAILSIFRKPVAWPRFLACAALGLCLLLAASTPVPGQAVEEERESFELAQRLFDNRDYANAAQEFRRFSATYPTSARLPSALYQLGEARFLGEHYKKSGRRVRGLSHALFRTPRSGAGHAAQGRSPRAPLRVCKGRSGLPGSTRPVRRGGTRRPEPPRGGNQLSQRKGPGRRREGVRRARGEIPAIRPRYRSQLQMGARTARRPDAPKRHWTGSNRYPNPGEIPSGRRTPCSRSARSPLA